LTLNEEKKTAGSAKNQTISDSKLAEILLDKIIKKEYNIVIISIVSLQSFGSGPFQSLFI